MNRKSFLKKFAIFSIFIACIHFILETLFTLRFGQTFAGLLPDYIAVAHLITRSFITIKDSNVIGILCGAWGFTFCLHYRSWAWRFEAVLDGTATSVDEITMYVLGSSMLISIICFTLSLLMCLPKEEKYIKFYMMFDKRFKNKKNLILC